MKPFLRTSILCTLGLAAQVCSAAIFTVNVTVFDATDNALGDGECRISGGDFCTLRAAVMEANALPGPDIIVLPEDANIVLDISPPPVPTPPTAANGDLEISETVIIGTFTADIANFPTIDARNLNDRVFDVLSTTDIFTLQNVRVRGGNVAHGTGVGRGGAIRIFSGVGEANIFGVDFFGNTADRGGAIYADRPQLLIEDSRFHDNAVNFDGAAIAVDCGGVTIRRSSIFENLNINPDPSSGEAIFHQGDELASPACELVIENSSIVDNASRGINSNGDADLRLFSSLVAHHSNFGIRMTGDAPGQTVTLEMKSSILADNHPHNCQQSIDVFDIAHNILDNSNSCGFEPTTNMYRDPKLDGPQQDLHSWHHVSPLRPNSPAIDASLWNCFSDDIRTASRPLDGDGDSVAICDIGPLERNPAIADLIFVDEFGPQ